MIGYFKNKWIKVLMVPLILFSTLIFTSTVEAKGATAPTNTAPVISQGDVYSLTINENTSGTVNLKATDANKDVLSWNSDLITSNGGTVTIGNLTNVRGTSSVTVTYAPKSGYTGADQFSVTVSDRKATDSIIIKVTINKGTISYVALGDSIASGTIYSGKVITSYTTYFHEYLKTQYPLATVTKSSLATDGDRTNELYGKLGLNSQTSQDNALISAVTNADIITLSIGGNNLMQAAKDSSSIGGYNFNFINTAIADQGLLDFQNQWVPIISKIKSLNPNVQLIVTTTYNPYNETDASLHNTVDSYLFRVNSTGVNDYIINNSGSLGYSVANVYQYFDANYKNNMGAVTYFYPNPNDIWGNLTRNPHPNDEGQRIITNLCKGVFVANS